MVQARLDARLLGEAGKLALDRGDQTEVVERRRAQLAGEPKELLHGLVHERLEGGYLLAQRVGGVLAQRLEAQEDRGQRLVDLVVEVAREAPALLLLGAQHQPAGPAPLVLDTAQQAAERDREPLDLFHRGTRQHELRRRLRRVDRLDAVDQRLER